MNQKHLLRFIKKRIKTDGDVPVCYKDKTKKEVMTLKEVGNHVTTSNRGSWPQINTKDPRPIPPRVMGTSAMGSIWGSSSFADYTRKNKHKANASTIFAWCTGFYGCLSSPLHCSTCRLHTHTLRSTIILIMGKTWRPRIWAPCQYHDGAGSGISGVYLWSWTHTTHNI